MRKILNIFKFVIFLGLLGMTIYEVTKIMLPKIPDFYQEEHWDVVFFGTSQSYCSFDPEIFDEYGLKTYNRGRQQQPMNYTYYYVKDALEVSDIDVIVLEIFGTFYDADATCFTDVGIRDSSLNDLRYSETKIDLIREVIDEENQFEYFFPLDKYHTNWEKWDTSSIDVLWKSISNPYYTEESDRGYLRWKECQECGYASWEMLFSEVRADVYDENMYYLEKIYELCQENDTRLILTRTPFPCYDTVIGKTNTVYDWAMEHNVEFINFMQITGDIGLDFGTDSLDGGVHLNESGAEKVSRYLADYIVNYFDQKTFIM